MSSKIEAFLFGKVERWVVGALMILGFVAMILFGALVRTGTKHPELKSLTIDVAVSLASIPENITILIEEGIEMTPQGIQERSPLLMDFDAFQGLNIVDKDFKDDGYLLCSAYSLEHHISTVFLYDLKAQKRLWEWVPDYDAIISQFPQKKQLLAEGHQFKGFVHRSDFRMHHPIVYPDGSLLFSFAEGPLVKIDRDSNIVWTLEGNFHHAISQTQTGDLMIPISDFKEDFRVDSVSVVSPEGKFLGKKSVFDMLSENGYDGLLYGVGNLEWDRIHLNDAEPIHVTDKWVKKGDIMMSSRHLSTVWLYRPSTGKIIWLKTGPFLNQHDPDYLGNGVFSIFGNDSIRHEWREIRDYSNIYLYDMKTDSFATPYDQVFRDNQLYTKAQGLHRILPNGDAFLDMTEMGMLLRVSPNKVRWRFVNNVNNKEVGKFNWCRYYTRDEVNLGWLEE